MSRNLYLSNYELDEALDLYFNKINLKPQTEMLDTSSARGRVTAQAVYAEISSPHYNASAMDGIATLSSRTIGASENNHLELVENIDYVVVDTGDPIPKEFDCVVMAEDLIQVDESRVKIYKSAVSWQNIRLIGEDLVQAEMLVPCNYRIRHVEVGAILAGGVNQVNVYKKPLVGIIPTGTELVEPGSVLHDGDIIDFNSRVFAAQLEEWQAIPKRYAIVKDVYDDIKAAVKKASEECDVVLVSAGSSAGREDFTSKVISELGEVFVHGIAIKPGKPVILGAVNNKPVIGIPGYPVSAFFIMERIVKRIVSLYQGMDVQEGPETAAVLSRRVMSSLKYLEFVRVKLGAVGEKIIATPLNRGAGVTMSLVRADGVLEIPQNIEGLEAGTEVQIKLAKDLQEIKNTIVCTGSHDTIIDIAGDMLRRKKSKYSLASAHVGSMGGIMALRNKEAHIAPLHLLDMDSGEYNVSYIKRYLNAQEIALIKGVKRVQGLVLPQDNPLNINSIKDLLERKPRFINRQRGSGTRLLLDYNLQKLGLECGDISGYEREVFTHLAVAAAVATGDADVGLAIHSAAVTMKLDFLPLYNEEYDFAVPLEYVETEMIQEFINVLQSEEFKIQLSELGGYSFQDIGTIIML